MGGYTWNPPGDGCPIPITTDTPPMCVGNPIDPSTGNKVQTEVDFAGTGIFPLRMVRTYSKRAAILGDAPLYAFSHDVGVSPDGGGAPTTTAHSAYFGLDALAYLNPSAWRSDFQRYLTSLSDNFSAPAIVAQRPSGIARFFVPKATGWVVAGKSSDTLVPVNDAQGHTTWIYHDANSAELEVYNTEGLLIRITKLSGANHFISYNNDEPFANTISDDFGRAIRIQYDGDHHITGFSDPAGQGYGYGFAGNDLVSVSYPDSQSKSYHYNESSLTAGLSQPHALTGITDENGNRFANFSYDATGQAIVSEHAGSKDRYELQYAYNGQPTVTDPLGTSRTYSFANVLGSMKLTSSTQPGGSGCSASYANATYDASGNVSSRIDFDRNLTCFAYDQTRNLETKRVEGIRNYSANCTTALSTPPGPTSDSPARTISTQWHPDWALEIKRAEPKKITTWVYNGQPDPTAGNVLAACAPATAKLPDGKPIAVICKQIEQATTDTTGASGFGATATGSPRTWTWTYNNVGQVLTANGPRTNVTDTTTYAYYTATDFSNPATGHTLGDLWKVTNAVGHVTEYVAYDKNGRLLKSKDPNGLVTTLSYTPRGWLKTRKVGTELTTYDYDKVGQLKKVTLADGSWIGYDYDPAHRLVAMYDNKNNRITYTLDNAGNRTKEDVTDPSGTLKRTHSRVYDALGRVQNVIQPQ